MIVGAYQDIDLSRTHPLSRTLGVLAEEQLFDRVVLRGLSPNPPKEGVGLAS